MDVALLYGTCWAAGSGQAHGPMSILVEWLSAVIGDYRDRADKSTKFGMKFPLCLPIKFCLGATLNFEY